MKKKHTIAGIGTFDFTKTELTDTIEIYVDIVELPEEIKADVDKAVETGKEQYLINWKKCVDLYGYKWSDKGVNLSPQLHIIVNRDGKIEYELAVFYQDKECEDLFDSVYLPIDTVINQTELKKLIVNGIINAIF